MNTALSGEYDSDDQTKETNRQKGHLARAQDFAALARRKAPRGNTGTGPRPILAFLAFASFRDNVRRIASGYGGTARFNALKKRADEIIFSADHVKQKWYKSNITASAAPFSKTQTTTLSSIQNIMLHNPRDRRVWVTGT